MDRVFTWAILLDETNAGEIAYFEDISVGSAANLIARELKYTSLGTENYVLFGYTTHNGDRREDWAVVTKAMLEENFKPVPDSINKNVVKVYYKD